MAFCTPILLGGERETSVRQWRSRAFFFWKRKTVAINEDDSAIANPWRTTVSNRDETLRNLRRGHFLSAGVQLYTIQIWLKIRLKIWVFSVNMRCIWASLLFTANIWLEEFVGLKKEDTEIRIFEQRRWNWNSLRQYSVVIKYDIKKRSSLISLIYVFCK